MERTAKELYPDVSVDFIYQVTFSELEREKLQTQYLMKPIIQAEEDRTFLRTRYKMLKFVRDNKLDVDLQFYHNPRYYDSSIPLF